MRSLVVTWQGIQHLSPSVLVFFKDLDAITRSQLFFESKLAFSTIRGVINAVGIVWSSQHPLPLCQVFTWAGLFSSDYNRRFGWWDVRLEGGCFNFWGLRLLLRLPLTVGSTSDALAYSHLSDWELRFNPCTPCLSSLWVRGVFIPLILHIVPHSEPWPSSFLRHFLLLERYFPPSFF